MPAQVSHLATVALAQSTRMPKDLPYPPFGTPSVADVTDALVSISWPYSDQRRNVQPEGVTHIKAMCPGTSWGLLPPNRVISHDFFGKTPSHRFISCNRQGKAGSKPHVHEYSAQPQLQRCYARCPQRRRSILHYWTRRLLRRKALAQRRQRYGGEAGCPKHARTAMPKRRHIARQVARHPAPVASIQRPDATCSMRF